MNIRKMLSEIGAEIDEEKAGAMSESDRRLHAIAQRLLLLERDLKAPGAARTSEERAERLLEAIAKESF